MRLETAGTIRPILRQSDIPTLRAIAAETRVFNQDEIGFITEIGEDIFARGTRSEYRTLIAQNQDRILGFTIFGLIPGTDRRSELYWIATDPAAQRSGVASALMRETMAQAVSEGSSLMFIETSTRPGYGPAHALYRSMGFELITVIADYYADGDGKAVFGRRL